VVHEEGGHFEKLRVVVVCMGQVRGEPPGQLQTSAMNFSYFSLLKDKSRQSVQKCTAAVTTTIAVKK
jgi:hypothetical protein